MKKIAFLSIALLGATSFAATPTMTFSYGADMTERHRTTESVKLVGSYEVPKVDDGMPTSDTVATTHFVLADMTEVPADDWVSATACAAGSQAALCIKENVAENGSVSLAWMGYSNGEWVELTGVTPAAGAWEVKMDFDYTLGTERVLVRYSVKNESTGDYVVLQPSGASSSWLETGIAAGKRITSVGLNGWCDLTSATAESGLRQGYAETTTVEDYRMDNSGVTLEITVGETWGVDTLVATVKEDGEVKGMVQKKLSEAKDGKVRLELPGLAKGKCFTYELKLTGEYSGSILVCQKDGGTVNLPAVVPEATVSDGKINLASNAELDLSKTSLVGGKEYTVVQNQEGKKFHLRWTDAANSYATRSGDKLTVHEGTPANGLKSFASYALGLEPTEPLDKPVAVVQEGGMQSKDGVTVHVPNVVAANLPDSGVTVIHRLQRSGDKGEHWADTETSAGPGGTLVVPFESGVLYRVNTVLK